MRLSFRPRFVFAIALACMLLAVSSTSGSAKNNSPWINYFSIDDVLEPPVWLPGNPGPPPPMNASELDPYLKGGTGEITGKIVVKTKKGDISCDKDSEVFLLPATPYVKWTMKEILYQYHRTQNEYYLFSNYWDSLLPPGARLGDKVTTVRDAMCKDGIFDIKGLHAGSYFLFARVEYQHWVDLPGGVDTHIVGYTADGPAIAFSGTPDDSGMTSFDSFIVVGWTAAYDRSVTSWGDESLSLLRTSGHVDTEKRAVP